MAIKFALLFLCAALASAVENSADYDALVDQRLQAATVDEAQLEDLDVDIERDIFIATFTGNAKLSDGHVSGLTGVARYGPTKAKTNPDNSTAVVVPVEYAQLNVVYNQAEVSVNNVDFNGTYAGHLKKLHGDAHLTVSADNTVSVDTFVLKSVKSQSFRVEGVGLFPFRFFAALKDVNDQIKDLVATVVADNLKGVLEAAPAESA